MRLRSPHSGDRKTARTCFSYLRFSHFFFFKDRAPPEIYPLSLHDALPILVRCMSARICAAFFLPSRRSWFHVWLQEERSEEHTSELQSRVDISYAVFC